MFAVPETRSLGGLAWHIACWPGEMMTAAGLPLGMCRPNTSRSPLLLPRSSRPTSGLRRQRRKRSRGSRPTAAPNY